MNRTRWLSSVFLLVALAFALPPGAARGEGSGALDAIAPDGRALGGCPLEHTDVHATVAGFVARVEVTQTFRSTFAEPVEAVYTFPLSDRGAVDAMTMRIGDRTIEGQIRRREDARREYEQAKAAGKTASLLDEERPNVFTQRVANLMPGATVEIRIAYVEPLEFEAGTFSLVVPTVVGPRFSPPGTRDADAVAPPVTAQGTRAGHDLSITVDIDAAVPIRDVASALHAVDVARPTPERARVTLRDQREIPNRDFVLRWSVSGDALQSGYLTYRPDAGDGYVSLVLLPPKRVGASEAAPKEMVFVIDRSGSQMGAPLDKAKETMRYALDHMNPNDTFQVVDFGSTSNVLFAQPELATPEMKRRARQYIDALEANGGTMMADAIERVCAMPADANRLRIVTFMTDGYVGNDLEVLGLVKKLRARSRWFPFGTGNGVNRLLIDGMARLGGGEAEYVLLTSSGDEAGKRFYDRIASPVLTDVKVEWQGLDVVDVLPHEHADVWAERPLVIHARYRSAGTGQVVLTGFQHGRPYRQVLPVTLPEREQENGAIASMWARAKVEALTTQDLGAMQSGTFPKPLEEQIVQVALAHRLLTPFTSFVAVEERVVNEGGTSRTVRLPVEMPDGVRYEGVFGTSAADVAQAASGVPRAQMLAAVPLGAAGKAAPAAPPVTVVERSRRELRDGGRTANESDDALAQPERAPTSVRLDATTRVKLAPALLVLAEQGVGAPGAARADDGWVRVRVVLAKRGTEADLALQSAGFLREGESDAGVVGLVRVGDLAALARLAEVRSVAVAPDAQ
ncbi:MAG: VIT and VWA domain-containing protein [Candidatus Binatia bacterium]